MYNGAACWGPQSKYRRPNSRGAFVGGPEASDGSREMRVRFVGINAMSCK